MSDSSMLDRSPKNCQRKKSWKKWELPQNPTRGKKSGEKWEKVWYSN
ncbi:hypothetical protein [Microcoleus sp. CAWBG24]|nr:hypothetical protein [Microcoleus sp. CAWBG24]